jgi:16S rRNA (cytidine1402-2'-O)-methyltransferase
VAALAAGGLPTDSFAFHGFLPAKRGQRRKTLEQIQDSHQTQVFYEAPHRLVEALEDVVEVLGPGRPIVVARELTKLHEQLLRGSAGDVLGQLASGGATKGEVTLLIGKPDAEKQQSSSPSQVSIRQHVRQIMREEGVDEKAALKKVARDRGISKSEAYRELQRSR